MSQQQEPASDAVAVLRRENAVLRVAIESGLTPDSIAGLDGDTYEQLSQSAGNITTDAAPSDPAPAHVAQPLPPGFGNSDGAPRGLDPRFPVRSADDLRFLPPEVIVGLKEAGALDDLLGIDPQTRARMVVKQARHA